MIPQILAALENHLWQSTLFAVLAGLLTLALRGNRARVRHAIWLAASLKFLIPFSMLTWLGSQIEWRKPVASSPPTSFAIVLDEVAQPFETLAPPLAVAPPRTSTPWPTIVLTIWAIGFLGIATSWLIRWRRIRATVRSGSPIELAIPIRAISSPTLLEPGVFGVFRPILLLPDGIIDRLTLAQLQSVIEHELCHVRYRDNLIATIQMFIETVFWFHPLVWWIGKRMVAERERACDEAVVSQGNEAHVYAEAILNVCKLYVESPLVCVAGLKQRIAAIVANRPLRRLNRAKKLLLTTAAAITLVIPIAIGIANAPSLRAQPASNTPIPQWEVISIKPCDGSAPVGRSGGGGGGRPFSPGTLNANCAVPIRLIEEAYGFYANGRGPTWKSVPIEGAPSWLNSERYTIAAKAESPQGRAMMFGPMMQKLLEDRFKLRIRKEIREVPIYNLTISKGGPKYLTASKPGTCVALDLDNPPPPQGDLCKMFSRRRVAEGEREFEEFGVNMAEFSDGLAAMTGRNVIDKTGLAGTFDIKVQVSLPDDPPRDPSQPRTGPPDESELVFAVVQKLGMKLESSKGPGVVYVIESIERPSDNFTPPQAPPIAPKPQQTQAPAQQKSARFEVASIKPGAPGAVGPNIYNPTRERFAIESITTKALIAYAYDVREFQIAGGPGWLRSEEYTIVARPEGDAGRERILAMVRNLLAERFHLTVHHESKEMPVLELVIAKGGPKLRPSAGTDGPEVRGGRGGLIARNVTMEMLASQLAGRVLVRPVLDRTGVPGKFDINLEWTLDESSDTGPSVFTALEEQLGLKLETRKGPVDMLVIDRAQRPTAN